MKFWTPKLENTHSSQVYRLIKRDHILVDKELVYSDKS